MFTLQIHHDKDGEKDYTHISLHFIDDRGSLTFHPEMPDAIKDIKWEDGCFDTGPCYGQFSLFWKDNYIVMNCGKYGGGDGGDLTIRLKKTPELIASLKQAFDQWKTLY